MTTTADRELVELWRTLTTDERANLVLALPDDEVKALEIALGPDPAAVDQARADTDDLIGFVRDRLPELMPLEPGPHHHTIANAIDVNGPTGVRFVAGAPRGSGKSTVALTALPIVTAIRRSHRFVVVIRDNLPDAVTSVYGIRTLLENRPELIETYPWIRPLPGEKGELHLAGGVVILARSTGSAIRGLNRTLADGTIARPDLVIGDDLEDDVSARSTLQTGRLVEWLLGTIGQLGGPPGDAAAASLDLLVIGTTLETNALVSKMLDGRDGFAPWRRHRFPAQATVEHRDGEMVATDTADVPVSVPVPDDAEVGDRIALWPEGMPLDYLDRLSDPDDELFVGSVVYSREYLLRPRQRTDVLFAADRTVWADLAARWLDGEIPVEREAIGADPAVSVREVADYTAIVVTATAFAGQVLSEERLEELNLDPDRRVIIVPHAERRRATPAELLDWIEETAAIWIPSGRVAFEAEGGFAWAADELRRRGAVSSRPVTTGGVDKRTRAVPLSVWQESRRLIIDEALRGGPFDVELHSFTGTGSEEHDDLVDALVWGAAYSTNAWRRR